MQKAGPPLGPTAGPKRASERAWWHSKGGWWADARRRTATPFVGLEPSTLLYGGGRDGAGDGDGDPRGGRERRGREGELEKQRERERARAGAWAQRATGRSLVERGKGSWKGRETSGKEQRCTNKETESGPDERSDAPERSTHADSSVAAARCSPLGPRHSASLSASPASPRPPLQLELQLQLQHSS
ncbi:hypothetical protein M758_4G176300 [Ceratodon purpureus]|nr:hypothetical protein M758_4G176300 [Ceratodon purpureus]